jgi:glycolate oxidase FAD binding subunit
MLRARTMPDRDLSAELGAAVRAACEAGTPLRAQGGASKAFLGRAVQTPVLSLAGHRGITSYQPSELVVSARSGTPLSELEDTLAASGQMLPFEPPHFGAGATVGGTIACGLSGPRRPYAGAARDFVLGVRLINGSGEVLRFGGEVMKNVAGYDVSRLMTGSMGTLAVLLEVSMKVLPRPQAQTTLAFEHTPAEAVRRFNAWAGQPLPLSAACHLAGRSFVRLSGSARGIDSAVAQLGGEAVAAHEEPWTALREHRLAPLRGELPLWRLSVPPTTPPLALPGEAVIDWGGALRWLCSDADPGAVRSVVAASGGHATLFRGAGPEDEVFHPLAPAMLRLHQRIKAAFDPRGILNPGAMYAQI